MSRALPPVLRVEIGRSNNLAVRIASTKIPLIIPPLLNAPEYAILQSSEQQRTEVRSAPVLAVLGTTTHKICQNAK
ncbi:MAG: hypothetical protein IPH22_10695 [Nitrosomonas sp.]|nr:hypothetical protein [Nitrosomonas sp.]